MSPISKSVSKRKKAQEARQLAEEVASLQEQLCRRNVWTITSRFSKPMVYWGNIRNKLRLMPTRSAAKRTASDSFREAEKSAAIFEEKQAAKTKAEQRLTQRLKKLVWQERNDARSDCPSRSNNRSLRRNQNLWAETVFVQQQLALLDAQLKETSCDRFKPIGSWLPSVADRDGGTTAKTIRKQEKVNGNQRLFDELQHLSAKCRRTGPIRPTSAVGRNHQRRKRQKTSLER